MKPVYFIISLFIILTFNCCSDSLSGGNSAGADDYPAGDGLLDPYSQNQALGKGVNFGNLLEASPDEGSWTGGLVIEESNFTSAKSAGFDSVRLPVGFSLHADAAAPYTISPVFFARVDQVVEWGLSNGLRIVIDLHNYAEIMTGVQSESSRFIGIWKNIASHYKSGSDNIYYELLNEPNTALTVETWNILVNRTLRAIRAIDNHHTIVVGCVSWSDISGLQGLQIPQKESNVIVTFHYYNPTLFCFQGKPWMGIDWSTTNVVWPGPPPADIVAAAGADAWVVSWISNYNAVKDSEYNPAGYMAVRDDIARAYNWGIQNKRPLWMGEFTAQDGADLASRSNWIAYVRTQLESRQIPWSFWSLFSDSGTLLYDSYNSHRWNNVLMGALGMSNQ